MSISAKRVPPPVVAPVTIAGTRYEAVHWGARRGLDHNGGYLAAIDIATGDELWTLEVYPVTYDAEMEEDVQEVFVTKLRKTLFGKKLKITDEAGRRYLVDTATRTVSPL